MKKQNLTDFVKGNLYGSKDTISSISHFLSDEMIGNNDHNGAIKASFSNSSFAGYIIGSFVTYTSIGLGIYELIKNI